MNNFFDKYELYTNGDSIYCYKGTNVLKNKLEIQDSQLLKQPESDIVFTGLLELDINPIRGNFDKKHLYKIHKFLFKDLYYFAGETRKEDISKGNTKFCVFQYIDAQLDELFANIEKTKTASLKDKKTVVKHLTYIMTELNIIHPFREGNGRTIREYIKELALALGYTIDWSKVDKETLLDAMIESVVNNANLEKLLEKIMH